MKFKKEDKLLIAVIIILAILFTSVVLFGENLLICKMVGEEYATIENGICVVKGA